MGKFSLIMDNISFSYESSESALFQDFSLVFSEGWTGVVGANGAGKSTLLKLVTGILRPVAGVINHPVDGIYCRQETDEIPDQFEEMLYSRDKSAGRIRSMLKMDYDWPARWNTLSHGERKRAQIGTALWIQPYLLAVDEPTNHLDEHGRQLLFNALKSFKGIGLIVSHDRYLLDNLSGKTLFLDPPFAEIRNGNYANGKAQLKLEERSRKKQRAGISDELKKLKREASKRRGKASHADKRISKKGISGKDHDAKEKVDCARLTGKDGNDGRALKRLSGRIRHKQEKLKSIRVKKNYDLGIWLPGSCSKRSLLFSIPAGRMKLSPGRAVLHPELRMGPDSRIGISGNNGTGKSSLIEHIRSRIDLREENILYLPQEISSRQSKELTGQIRNLPDEALGRIMTFVSRLGSRPGRLMETDTPSPGETRKLLIALGALKKPNLVIMDEPTNHLDLPSIECLEEALSNCPCGLLIVSHDIAFLSRVTETRWHLEKNQANKDISLNILF